MLSDGKTYEQLKKDPTASYKRKLVAKRLRQTEWRALLTSLPYVWEEWRALLTSLPYVWEDSSTKWNKVASYHFYTVFQKNVTTFSMISWSRTIRLQRFWAYLLPRV